MIRNPSCSKVRRDPQLNGQQMRVAASFISAPPPSAAQQRDFDAAWEIEVELAGLVAGPGALGIREWRQGMSVLRRRARHLGHAPSRAAAPSRLAIHRAALRYLRHCGGVENFNISTFVKYVQSRQCAQREYHTGRRATLGDHAIRSILKERIGIVRDRYRGRPQKKR